MMNSIDKITSLIPKFKQQLLFLNEREKLFIKSNDNLSSSSTNLNSSSLSSSSSSSSLSESVSDGSTHESKNNVTSEYDQSLMVPEKSVLFPDKYVIPPLPNGLLKDIQDGALNKFGPHYSNRQILIEAIANDLINKYKMFYPTHKQFQIIGVAIVDFLKLPLIQQNIAVWKDALQTKLKRKRFENRNNIEVQQYQLKYTRIGSGRPVKKRLGELAQKDRQKQIMLLTYDGVDLQNIQTKADKLRDVSDIDIHTQLHLWKETVNFRRQCIRDKLTSEILKEFPGYSNQLLIFTEVKMTTNVDLSVAVRQQIPILLEKLAKTPAFITDSPIIQLIKILCNTFDETVHHTLADVEPLTPYPTLVFADDKIHIYVDFILIVSTTSPDDALGLLIAMYNIFELNFSKNSRVIRFLYSILHSDNRFLSNAMRLLMKENNIEITNETSRQQAASSNPLCNNSTIQSSNTKTLTQQTIMEDVTSINQQNEIKNLEPTNSSYSNSSVDLNDKTSAVVNEPQNNVMDPCLSTSSQSKKINSRKRPQKQNIEKPINQKSSNVDNDQDEHFQENITPTNDAESSIPHGKNKRRRRY